MIPSMVAFSSLILKFPSIQNLVSDWAMFIYYYLFVVLGYLVMCNLQLIESMVRNRRFSMFLAFGSIILINCFRWNELEPSMSLGRNWRQSPFTYLYLSIYPLIAWSWILMLVGYAKKYMDKPHRLHAYVNQAIYPFYILHQTIIVLLAYYVVQVEESILTKYFFIVVVTFLLCLFIYHTLIKPFNVCRVLFGMKPGKKAKKGGTHEKAGSEIPLAPAV